MRKIPSKRRYKARWKLGKWLPMTALVRYQLNISLENAEYNAYNESIRRLK